METKIKHPISGQPVDVAKIVLTDNNATGHELYAINYGSQPVYRKTIAINVDNVHGYESFEHNAQYCEPLTIALIPLDGHQALPWNTKVTMDGEDVTSAVFDVATNSISITEVTGDISIEAEAVEMSDAYKPLEYIRNTSMTYNGTKYRYFNTGFKPTDKTHVEADFMIIGRTTQGLLFGLPDYTGTQPFFTVQTSQTSSNGAGFFLVGNDGSTSRTYDLNKRYVVTLDVNGSDLIYNGVKTSLSANSTLATPWASSNNLQINGVQNTANVYRGNIYKHYRYTIKDDGTLVRDYVPAKRLSDDFTGFYDVVNQTFLTQKTTSNTERADCIPPYVDVTSRYTNCAAAILTPLLTSGTMAMAVIGSTWSIKLSPDNSCSFEHAPTPTVTIDGVDVSSDVVTNNGDGTYTITITDVPNKPISIKAVAIFDVPVQGLRTIEPTLFYGMCAIRLVPATDYQMLPWNTIVTLDGEDVTETAYDKNTGVVFMENVSGTVNVVAEAVNVPSEYQVVHFIRNGESVGQSTAFNFNIFATEKSHIKFEGQLNSSGFAIGNRGAGSTNVYPPSITFRNRASAANTYSYCYWGSKASGGVNPTIPYHTDVVLEAQNKVWTIAFNGNTYTIPIANAEDTFTAAKKLNIMGTGNNSGIAQGYIYRFRHWVDDVLSNDFVPILDVDTGNYGLYDITTDTLWSKANTLWVGPGIEITYSLTKCTMVKTSASETGTKYYAVIGKTWSAKITPTSGYTFTGGTTPQVEIDGVDVTSQVVTDNGDGTYTVTIVDVPDKPIEITAACVADPNAVQSNSLLTGTPTNTPDEPMGDNSDEEEM